MGGRRFRCVSRLVPVACLFAVQLVWTQTLPLQVKFESVTIDSQTVIRGVRGGFPSYVLSLITVQDAKGRYVHGLADTSKWLFAADTTQIGLPVDSVWQQLLEYHQADTTQPALPDIKATVPNYRVTEVYDVEGFGLSVSLAMDYSGSLGDDIYKSEDAARIFVRQMTSSDEASIIKFTGKVNTVQSFTADTTLLMDAIGLPNEDREYTAIYDAAYTAVDAQRYQTGRRAVVLYTDGKDNYSSHGPDDIILMARDLEIPLFTIGVGPSLDADELQRMADETGGTYWHASTVDSLAQIYVQIFGLIRGYYVMAHTSPDPYYNGTWRWVDATLDDSLRTGRGRGQYYVPFKPADIVMAKRAQTDAFIVSGSDTTWTLYTDETVRYVLDVVNQGPSASPSLAVWDVPPPQLRLVSAVPPPVNPGSDTLRWTFGPMTAGQRQQIELTFDVDTLDTATPLPLLNTAWALSPQDTVHHNDRDSVYVSYVPLTPVDLKITKRVRSDSLRVQQGDTLYLAGPGDVVTYSVTVTNLGQEPAGPMTLTDVLPPELTWVAGSGPTASAQASGDTLRWTLDGLGYRGASVTLSYQAQVDDALPPWEQPLVNWLTLSSDEDATPGDNTVSDTLYVSGPAPPDPLIRLNPTRVQPTDSVAVEVYTPVHAVRWDLLVQFEDHSEITDYADAFITATTLTPGVWIPVVPDFGDTQMRTTQQEEVVAVILETEDVWQVVRRDTAWFTISSTDAFYLDENRWLPDDGPLGMRFQLSSNRPAEIIVYDISGAYVARVYDGPALAGWNRTTWDGLDDHGRRAGSGIYVAILRSHPFQKYRKFVLVR